MSEGQQLMELGKDKVEKNNKLWVLRMRAFARELSFNNGVVTADCLRNAVGFVGEPIHHNAWGAIFRTTRHDSGKWVVVGYRKSTRKEAHARRIAEWSYIEKEE